MKYLQPGLFSSHTATTVRFSLENSSKKKQTSKENYVFYCSVLQFHINPEKKHTKKHKNDVFGRTYQRWPKLDVLP